MNDFKIYDPLQQLIARDSFGGGNITEDVSMIQPAKIIQCQDALNECDLTNLRSVKTYVDSKISTTAGDTRFGLIKFDTTGDLSQTDLNSGIAKLKPTTIPKQIKGSNTNDTVVRDLTLSDNFKVDNTLNSIDLTYEYQKKLDPPAEDEVAIFNSQGFVTNSSYKFDTSNDPPSQTTLWSSWRTWVSSQLGCTIFKQTESITVKAGITSFVPFSNTEILGDRFQYEDISTAGTSVKIDNSSPTSSVVVIENLFRFPVFYKITFSANFITVTGAANRVDLLYTDEFSVPFVGGIYKTLVLGGEATLPWTVKVAAATNLTTPGSFKFKVAAQNPTVLPGDVILKGDPINNPSLLYVERTA
jgi:hypothetical protein